MRMWCGVRRGVGAAVVVAAMLLLVAGVRGVRATVDPVVLTLGEEIEGGLSESTFPTAYFLVDTRSAEDAGHVVGVSVVLVGDLDLFVSRSFSSPSALNAEHKAAGRRLTRSLMVLNSGKPPFEMGRYYVGVAHRLDLGEASAFALLADVLRDGEPGLARGGAINVTDHDPLRLRAFAPSLMSSDWQHTPLLGDDVQYAVWVCTDHEMQVDSLGDLPKVHMLSVEGVKSVAKQHRAHVKRDGDAIEIELGSLSAGVHVLNIVATHTESGREVAYVPQVVLVKEHRSAVVALAEFLVYGVAPLLSLCFGTSYLFSGRDET